MEQDQELAELFDVASRVMNRMETMYAPTSPSPPPLVNHQELPSPLSINEPITPPDLTTDEYSSSQEQPSPLPKKQRLLSKKCIKKEAKKRVESLWQVDPKDVFFYGTVHCALRPEATEVAQAASGSGSTIEHLALWTNASGVRSEMPFGYSVASQFEDEGWKYKLGRSSNARGLLHAQLKGIKMAMEEAVRHVRHFPSSEPTGTVVRIFSSSQAALRRVSNLPFVKAGGTLLAVKDVLSTLEEISQLSGTLRDLGAELNMHWVPAADNVVGNRVALSAAKYARLSSRKLIEEDWRAAVPTRYESEAGPSSERVERDEEDVPMQDDEKTQPWWKGWMC